MENYATPTAAVAAARRARRGDESAYYYGYASGLTEAQHNRPRDQWLHAAVDPYARGYSAGYAHGQRGAHGDRRVARNSRGRFTRGG